MKQKLLILAMVSTFLTTSCATIFTGTKDPLFFNSDPGGATVYIDGLEVCTTPCTTNIKRSISEKLVEFRMEGYETKVIALDRKFNIVSIINLIDPLGWAIDAATGSLMRYDQKGYEVELDKERPIASIQKVHRMEVNSETKTIEVYVLEDNE